MASIVFSGVGLKLTFSKNDTVSDANLILFLAISGANMLLGIITMVFVLIRFRTKGMSENIKKQIKQRYLEFIIVYSLLEGPFIYYAKPAYEYADEYGVYVGSTRYIENAGGFFVTIFGFLIALSRMRDRIIRAKVRNIWYQVTCRRYKSIKFDEFETLVSESQMNTFLKTSLNTELVITILKGIVILAASASDKIDHMDDSDLYRIKQLQ